MMQRVLGLDVGDKAIAVACSDELSLTAQGVTVRRRQALATEVAAARDVAERYEVASMLVGLPPNMDGSIGP